LWIEVGVDAALQWHKNGSVLWIGFCCCCSGYGLYFFPTKTHNIKWLPHFLLNFSRKGPDNTVQLKSAHHHFNPDKTKKKSIPLPDHAVISRIERCGSDGKIYIYGKKFQVVSTRRYADAIFHFHYSA